MIENSTLKLFKLSLENLTCTFSTNVDFPEHYISSWQIFPDIHAPAFVFALDFCGGLRKAICRFVVSAENCIECRIRSCVLHQSCSWRYDCLFRRNNWKKCSCTLSSENAKHVRRKKNPHATTTYQHKYRGFVKAEKFARGDCWQSVRQLFGQICKSFLDT